jgi:hypothetical protein
MSAQYSLGVKLSTAGGSTPTIVAQSATNALSNAVQIVQPTLAIVSPTPLPSTAPSTNAPDGMDIALRSIFITILVVLAAVTIKILLLGMKKFARAFVCSMLTRAAKDEEADWWIGNAVTAPAKARLREDEDFRKSVYAGIVEDDDDNTKNSTSAMIRTSSTITRAVSDILAYPTPAHVA